MTYTKDDESSIAGLNLVMRSLLNSTQTTPLTHWLPESDHPPTWIPLTKQSGITKVMLVSKPQLYPALMQSICQQIGWNTAVEWQGKPYELTGVEVDTHALHVLQIPIFPAKPFPRSMGRAIHAQFFHWLATADAALAEKLHQQDNLPMTLSLESSLSQQQPSFRISLLQRELLTPLLLGLSKDLGGEITLADISCRLSQSVDIIQTSNFEQLGQIPSQEVIELRFLVPTSFKYGQNVQPFPLPEMVFSSLLRRWNAFAPEHLRFPKVEWQGLVAMYELKTKTFKMEGGSEIGAVGWVRYRFPDREQARIATTLAHFAAFAGVGRKTAMGMGQTQLIS